MRLGYRATKPGNAGVWVFKCTDGAAGDLGGCARIVLGGVTLETRIVTQR
jgi:hypothetical protein